MASIIELVDESSELEVEFFGEITSEESGHDGGEYWGGKYASTIQTHSIVEVIEWDKALYTTEQNENINAYLLVNFNSLEDKICKQHANDCD